MLAVTTTILPMMLACTTTVVETPQKPSPAPASTEDGGAGTSTTASGQCVEPGTACSTAPGGASCCNGALCVYDVRDATKEICATTCLRDDQCNSGCCKALENGTAAVCAPASYCATCVAPGGSCAAGQACCGGAICVVTSTDTSCADTCTTHSQCKSGCCAPLQNSATKVCSPQSFCL